MEIVEERMKSTDVALVLSWSWSARERGCAENSDAAGWQATPANAGWPALSSEQNRTEQFRVFTLFYSQQLAHYTGLKRH